MTKFEFLRNMVAIACNRRRQQLGLEPVNYAQMERSQADGPAKAPVQPFKGKETNPLPLGGKEDTE